MIKDQIKYCKENGIDYKVIDGQLCIHHHLKHRHLLALVKFSNSYKKVAYGYIQKEKQHKTT